MKKVYDEDYVNNIATVLQNRLHTTDKFRLCDMADAVNRLMDFDTLTNNNVKRIWEVKNISADNPSKVIYYPTDDTYFMLPCSTPVSLQLGFGYETGTSGRLKAGSIRINPYANSSGRMGVPANYTTSTAKRIDREYPCLSEDYNNFQISYIDLTVNTGDLLVSPMQIFGLTSDNSHPALYSRFNNLAIKTLSSIFSESLKASELFSMTDVPAGFNLNNITQGYLIRSSSGFNFAVSEASETQVYVDSNGKLNSTSATVYQTTNFGISSDPRYTMVDQRLVVYGNTVVNATGSTTIADNLILTTNDIYNSNNELVMSANATLQDFKDSFNLS